MRPNIGLTTEQRDGVVRILTTLLADEYVLYTKTRNYHWERHSDAGTGDFLTGLLEEHEKMAWTLRPSVA